MKKQASQLFGEDSSLTALKILSLSHFQQNCNIHRKRKNKTFPSLDMMLKIKDGLLRIF